MLNTHSTSLEPLPSLELGAAPTIPTAALATTVIIDGVAIGWLLTHPGVPAAAWTAAAIHVAAILPLVLKRVFPSSQRSLAITLALSLPLIGSAIAAVALGTRGRSEIGETVPEEADLAPPSIDTADAHHLTAALSCCEALLSGDVDQRRAILGALNRRADANAIRILRWALGASDSDLAVEAALALEDIGAGFEARLFACREELASGTATFAGAMGLAETVSQGLEVGIVDAPLIPSLAQEARAAYDQAAALDPARYDLVVVSRAEMEILLLRPDNALSLIDHALPTVSPALRDRLLALRQEAVLASHSLPWEGPSALATYRQPPMPPTFASGRNTVAPSVSRTNGTGTISAPERGRTSPRFPLYPVLGAESSRVDG